MINRVKAVLLAAAVAAGALSGLTAPAPLAAVVADEGDEAVAAPGELAWGTKFTSSDGRTICYCDGGNQCTPCIKF